MLERGRTGHGTRVREAGCVAQERIMVEGREESPLALNRASQMITAAAILLRAMPEPSMPEGCNLCKEA